MKSAARTCAWLALVAMAAGGCGGSPPRTVATMVGPAPVQVADRQVVAEASMDLTVQEIRPTADRIAAVVSTAEGIVESSRVDGDSRVRMEIRVPALRLSPVLDSVRTLGSVDHETLRTTDVTEEMSDLQARLDNLVAVRDRLRSYLDRAEDVEGVITVERELTRVQTEIDVLTARLELLRGRVAMSRLSLTLDRKRTLGPLGAFVAGTGWLLEKLVFIN